MERDITHILVKKGYMYFCVVMDWYSKSVFAWNISSEERSDDNSAGTRTDTMDTNLVLSTTQEAINRFGKPEIFNSDQRSQYTSKKHTDYLKNNGIKISMNSKR